MGNTRSRPVTTPVAVEMAVSKLPTKMSETQRRLLKACKMGKAELVAKLLANDTTFDINQGTRKGNVTPLLMASLLGHADIVALLLDHARGRINVNVVATLRTAAAPLFTACRKGHANVVAVLLDKARDTIDVNQPDYFGATPLLAACAEGHADTVALLLDKMRDTINVNVATIDGATPIWFASRRGHAQIVTRLLAHPGIDIDLAWTASDGTKHTPLAQAKAHGHDDVVALLQAHANRSTE